MQPVTQIKLWSVIVKHLVNVRLYLILNSLINNEYFLINPGLLIYKVNISHQHTVGNVIGFQFLIICKLLFAVDTHMIHISALLWQKEASDKLPKSEKGCLDWT